MTVRELQEYLKNLPAEWPVNILINSRKTSKKLKAGTYPLTDINSIGVNSEWHLSGAKGYVIRGPQVFLEFQDVFVADE